MPGRKPITAISDADYGDARGHRLLLGGVVLGLIMIPLLGAGGNPRSGLPDRAAAAPRRRSLHEGAAQAVRGVPNDAFGHGGLAGHRRALW